jgi:Fe-S-cluster containining protein
MVAFYTDLDAVIAAHGPTCRNRGDCCKFSVLGHKLYVTDVELAFFLRGQRRTWRPPTDPAACPYQIDGRCTARDHRPLGCRIFFCDDNARYWQGPEYERFLARLKGLGDRFSVPYRYREWLSALADLSPEIPAAPTSEKAVDRFPLPVIQ